jgi:hypothetical protein
MTKPLAKKKVVKNATKPAPKTVKTVEVKQPVKVKAPPVKILYPVDPSEGKEHEHF